MAAGCWMNALAPMLRLDSGDEPSVRAIVGARKWGYPSMGPLGSLANVTLLDRFPRRCAADRGVGGLLVERFRCTRIGMGIEEDRFETVRRGIAESAVFGGVSRVVRFVGIGIPMSG